MEITPHRIIDNFLPEEEHQDIYRRLMQHEIGDQNYIEHAVPMYFSDAVSDQNDTTAGGYLFNCLYSTPYPLSPHFEPICSPILKKIIPMKSLVRAKVNWYTRTPTVLEHSMHTDYNYPVDNILYCVNTCDGYTKLQCGTKIESVANRAILFRGDLEHCSTTTSDQSVRCNININYLALKD